MGCGPSIPKPPPPELCFSVQAPADAAAGQTFMASFDGVVVPVIVPLDGGHALEVKPGYLNLPPDKREGSMLGQKLVIDGVVGRVIKGDNVIVNGHFNVVTGDMCEVNGNFNWVKGDVSKVNGSRNVVSGDVNKVSGAQNSVTGDVSSVRGVGNTVTGDVAMVAGSGNVVSGDVTKVSGDGNVVTGDASHVTGSGNAVTGDLSRLVLTPPIAVPVVVAVPVGAAPA